MYTIVLQSYTQGNEQDRYLFALRKPMPSEGKEDVFLADEKLVIRKKRFSGATSVVSARLPVSLVEFLDRTAEEQGYNRNEIILLCLEFAVTHLEKE